MMPQASVSDTGATRVMPTMKQPSYSDNTENGLSRQLERVRCLNTMISSMLESLALSSPVKARQCFTTSCSV